jgi:tetratricopeptide (TPR) repeat protein
MEKGCQMVSVAMLLWLLIAAPQSNGRPLPDLALDGLPPASRDALQHLFDAARRAPDDPALVGRLAMALQAWELWDAAHAAYQRARVLAPSTFKWTYLDSIVLQRLGRAEDAVVALNAALAIDAHYLPARVKLAEALHGAGRDEDSVALFAELVRDPAVEPVAEFALGRAAAGARRYEEAVAHLTKATALFPEYGAAYYVLARAYRALGRADDAQHALEAHQRYGARWPAIDDPVLLAVTTIRTDARALLQRGAKLAAAGDLAGAIAAHEEALRQDPSYGQAHVELISLYGGLKNWTKAEEHFRAAVALGADPEEAHYNHGVLLGLQERWDEAADAYRLALEVNPHNPRARNNLGQILERRRGFEEAATEYQRAVEADPAFRLARFNLGRMLIALGRPRDAIAQLQQVTEPRDAESPRYLFALATAYVHAGQPDAGMRWATEAQRLALAYDQPELAQAIARHIASLR